MPDKPANQFFAPSPTESVGEYRRLYRGLKGAYDPSRVRRDGIGGTDFTDCPYRALQYAIGPRGMVLVVDVPESDRRVTEELWFDRSAKRLMLWGAFDDLIVAKLLAKELRAQVRRKGILTAPEEDKAYILHRYINDRCRELVLA